MKNFNFNCLQGSSTLKRVGMVLALCLITITQVWAGSKWKGNVFFRAPDNWDLTTNPCVQLCLTQDAYVTNSTHVEFWNLTRVGSTRLYYVAGDADHSSWNKEYVAFVANPTNWGSNDGVTISSCACYTATEDYVFSNYDNPYLYNPNGESNGTSLYASNSTSGTNYGDRLRNLINMSQTIQLYTNGSSSKTGGSVNITGKDQGYANGDQGDVNTTNSSTSVSADCAIGSTVTLTATPAYGYEFQGWYTASSGGDLVSSDAEYSYTCKGTKTLYARFTTQYAYVEGRFQVYNAARNSITTTYASGGQWEENSTNIKMTYDNVNHVHCLHTYMTPKELSAEHGKDCIDCNPYFYIKTSSSSTSLADVKSYRPSASGQTITAAGTSYKKAVSKATSSHSLRINSSDESGYVVLYFDGASDVWYELEHKITYSTTGSDSGSAPTDNTYYANGSTATAKDNIGLLKKDGKVFAGWSTSSGSSTVEYAPGASITMNSNDTLYPVFKDGAYLISLTGSGSSGTKDGTNFVAPQGLSSAAYTVNGVCFSKSYYKLYADQSSIKATVAAAKNYVVYDAKTTSSKVRVYAWNKNTTNDYKLYYLVIKEGQSIGEISDQYVTVNKNTGKMITIDASNTKGARVILSVENKDNLYITEVIAIEDGTTLKTGGEIGYELAFPGRAQKNFDINGIELKPSTDLYFAKASNPLEVKRNGYLKFTTTAAATQIQVTAGNAEEIYISPTSTYTDGEKFGGTADTHNRTVAAGTWYLSGSTTTALQISKVIFADAPTITYDANGGSSSMSTSKGVVSENGFTAPSGKTFMGWNTASEGGGVSYEPGDLVHSAVKLYAQWGYTLTYNCDEAESGCPSATAGLALPNPLPDAPYKPGYSFDGWYTNSAKTISAVAGASISENTTLYAKWTPQYASDTYTFFGNATVGSSPSKTVTTTTTDYAAFRIDNIFFTDSKIQYQHDGTGSTESSDYNGWKLKKTGTIKFLVEEDSDVKLCIGSIGDSESCAISYTDQDGDEQNNVAVSAGSHATYEVKGGKLVTISISVSDNTHSVTLKQIAISTSSSCSAAPTVSAATTSTTTATTQIVNCAGISSLGTGDCTITSYGFVYGTSTSPTLSNSSVEVGTTYTTTNTAFGATTLESLAPGTTYYVRPYATNGYGTAYGTQASFTTHYAITTGSHTNGSITVASSAAATSTVDISATGNTGYEFSSWSIHKTGDDKTTVTPEDDDASTSFEMPSYAVTVNATFSLIDYTITYNVNSGSISGDYATTYNYGTGATLPTDVTKSGYTFGGWYDNSGLTGDPVETISTSATGNKAYWAKWTCTTPTIGTSPSDATVCKDATKPELSVTASANGGTLSYQWYSNTTKSTSDATLLTDSTKAKMYAPTGTAGTKYYFCVVTNGTGTCSTTATSSIATVTVKTPVSISSDPSDVDNAVVSSASSLSVTATGTGTLTYQWQTCSDATPTSATDITSGSAYSNYNTATLSFTPGSVGTYYFRCKVTDDCGNTVYSNVATVTAKNNPTQYSVSGTASICDGDNTDITLSDSESGVSYQLYKGGVAEGDPKDGTDDAIVWSVSDEATYTVKAVGDEDYWERAMSGSAAVSFKTATSISTQPTTAVAATEGVNFTLGSDLVATGDGTLQYQWYSYSNSSGDDETSVRDASTTKTFTTSQASAGTYYYKVKVKGGCGDVYSNMITVTVSSGPCFVMMSQSDASKDSTISHNDAIVQGRKSCKTLTGGTVKYVNASGSGSMTVEKGENKGWKFAYDNDQLVITLSPGSYLQEGTTITVSGYTNSSGKGLKMNGVTIVAKSSTSGTYVDSVYTVKSTDTDLIGKNVLTITRISGTTSALYSISISNCDYCTPIEPSLSYSKTTFWLDEEIDSLFCSPTLNKDGSTGTVTYSSSDASIVWVGTYGTIYAEKRGTATITASIAADGTYCAEEATCEITVKSIDCGTNTIAEAVLNGTNSTSSLIGGTLVASGLKSSSPDYKLNDNDAKFGITMSSAFKVGDVINFKGTMDSDPTSTTFAVYASTTASSANLLYSTTLSDSDPIDVEIEVTEDNLTLLNTSKTVAVIRTKSPSDGQYDQNPHMKSVHIKRYTCPDILVFNDAEDDQSWSNADNWIGNAGQGSGVPTSDDRIYIRDTVTVDVETGEAVAARVHITDRSVMTVAKSVTMGKVEVESGSTLNVAKDGDDGITLALNTLYLKGGWNDAKTKYDMPRVYIDPKSTLTRIDSTINFDISVDYYNYYPFALPFDVVLKTYPYTDPDVVDYANKEIAEASTYRTHYAIREYDGAARAAGSSLTWKYVSEGDTLKAGKGYILYAKTVGGKGIIRFPMKVDNKWTAGGEKGSIVVDEKTITKNEVAVTAYGWDEEKGQWKPGVTNNRKGWNLLGVPFMSCYNTGEDMYSEEGSATLIKGRINYKTYKWEDSEIRYVTIPTYNFYDYIQANIADDDTVTTLLPGWCFFVQVEESGTLTFLAEDEAASGYWPIYAPRRAKASMPTAKTGIRLSGAGASDKTTILVSDKYSIEEYEINADLEKMFGENSYTLATYSLMGDTRLAYNAMSNADIMNVIPIGYRAPADGEYTFSINPRYAESEAFERVELIDYEEGMITDLLQYSYTFATERTQNDGRFALNVVKKQPEVTTDIEATGDEESATGVMKVIINDKMYIIRDGAMYDATGKRVKGGK